MTKRPFCNDSNWHEFRPLKFATGKTLEMLVPHLPLLGTKKMDGIRCHIAPLEQFDFFDNFTHGPKTYEMKLIPNRHVFTTLIKLTKQLVRFDGELLTYDENGKVKPYHQVESDIMTRSGTPNFKFHVFDVVTPQIYLDRIYGAMRLYEGLSEHVVFESPVLLQTIDDIKNYEDQCIADGWEGIVVRQPTSRYKFGRYTPKEGFGFKVKRFEDAEAVVIDFVEMMHNDNEATINEQGLQERSSHKAGKRPAGVLGALVCSGHNNVRFEIGSGFTAADRKEIWDNKDKYKMQVVTYKYQPHGEKTAPRIPIFKGFRRDVSPANITPGDEVL